MAQLTPRQQMPETTDPERELPAAKERANPRLNEAAEAIGTALGSATRQVQEVRERFTVIRGGAPGAPSTAGQIRETAQQKVEEVKERASSALEEARTKASRLAQDARESAVQRARQVRWRVTRLTHERPLAVLAGIGAAAFLLGIFLRIGRAKRG